MIRVCEWCQEEFEAKRCDAQTCSRKCRQAIFRLRCRATVAQRQGGTLTLAYADPPYPGRARRYYQDEEVDHVALIARLELIAPAGWALSTSADALREILPLCPPEARVCPWVKPIGASPRTHGLHNCWEPLIVVRGRQQQPGVRDWLCAQPARGGGTLPGRKSLAFCAFLFQCLGMEPGDELLDLYPGTGIVTRAWSALSRGSVAGGPADVSLEALDDASPGSVGAGRTRHNAVGSVAQALGDRTQMELSLGAPGDSSGWRCR